MEIKTIEIAGMVAVMNALRLPYGKEARSDVSFVSAYCKEDAEFKSRSDCFLNSQDIALLSALVKRGDEHAKVIRGLVVYAEINAPVYLWCELETHRYGHERLSSESTMHIDCKGLFGEDLVKAKQEISMGKMLRKVDMFSYQCLRNIVRQRYNHRLPQWHEFIKWVATLPLAKEFIFAGLDIDIENYV